MHHRTPVLLRSPLYLQIGLLLLGLLHYHGIQAQRLQGTLAFSDRPTSVLLLDTRGGDHMVIDSAAVDRKGRFSFQGHPYPAGFYQLAVNDSDRVDIILDPREREVRLIFTGKPLQENILVERSLENQRLWEYKMSSRSGQERLRSIAAQRTGIDTADQAAHRRLDSAEAVIHRQRISLLDRLVTDTASYFAHVVRTDRALSVAASRGALAIASAMDWTDGRLMRSSVYSRAVMAWMQTAPPELPDGFISAIDSLLLWTAPELEAWDLTRSLLVRIFDQYGPDFVSQYLVDRYVVGEGSLIPPDKRLFGIIADQLQVAVGAKAPEILLPDPITGDTTLLYDVLPRNRATIIFFYSSSCEHCHEQMPFLDRMYQQWRGEGLHVIGIALDADQEEFQQGLDEERFEWPAYSELIGWGSPAAKAFNVKATPTLFLLDKDGIIMAKPYDHQELEVVLEDLFK